MDGWAIRVADQIFGIDPTTADIFLQNTFYYVNLTTQDWYIVDSLKLWWTLNWSEHSKLCEKPKALHMNQQTKTHSFYCGSPPKQLTMENSLSALVMLKGCCDESLFIF